MPRFGLIAGLLLLLTVATYFISSGEGAVSFGYPDRCFFSVGKSAKGAWWFIDPKGSRFFSNGVDVVNYGGDRSTTGVAAYNDAVKRKFGNSQSAWADSVTSRLVSWNLNTMGAWCDSEAISKGMPYTRELGLGKSYGTWARGMFPDVFDPAWETRVNGQAMDKCSPYRTDPLLIGYFLDNEMWWGDDWRLAGSILDNMLISLNLTSPGRVRAVSFLKTRYPTITALNKAWNSSYTSFDTIKTLPNRTAVHTTDSNDFAYIASSKFFNVTVSAIRKVDPYHMIMGARFVGKPIDAVLKAAAEWNDVISINSYPSVSERNGPPMSRIVAIYNATNKPILIGEFAYKANDSGLPNTKGAGLTVATQAQRAQGYRNYTTTLAPHPALVGFHWFQWVDQPVAGRESDGENSNFGLVNKDDVTYTDLTNMMKTTIPTLTTLHESTTTGLKAAKCYTTLTCPNGCSGHGCCNTKTGVCKCDTGFLGANCGTDASKLQVTSFGSSLNTTVWVASTSTSSPSEAFQPAKVSTSSNQLKLSISPCTTAAPCSGKNFSAGSVFTQSTSFGYGIYTAFIKAPATTGFTAQFGLNSRTSSLDAITLRVRANQGQGDNNGGTLDYYNDGTYKYLKWIGGLALGNPSSGFHNYTIHYMPTYFAVYAGGALLGSFNSTTAQAGLPNSTMAITLFVSATNTSPKVSDAMYVQSVSYTQVGGTKATC